MSDLAEVLADAIRDAVRLLETGQPCAARRTLRSAVTCPPPLYDAPDLPDEGDQPAG